MRTAVLQLIYRQKSSGGRSTSVSHANDRPTPGGGILAYVNNHIPTIRLTELEVDGKEALWLLLKPARIPRPYSSIVVTSVYFPPGQTAEDEREMYEYITKGLDSVLHDRPSAGIIVAGDFNKMRRFNRRFDCVDASISKKPCGLLLGVGTF